MPAAPGGAQRHAIDEEPPIAKPLASPPAVPALWDDDPRGRAPRAVEIARAMCTCDDRYHVIWPLLRAAGIMGRLRPREDEILSLLMTRLVPEGARLLIAGSADTATFSTVGRIAAPKRPAVTVLDRCKAPLALVEEFADERGVACRTLHQDLAELGEECRWDIVLLHYTFRFIAPDERADVIGRLARALVPGGSLICVNKDVASLSLSEAPAAAAQWLEKAREKLRAEDLDRVLPAPLYDELLRQAAQRRTLRQESNPDAADLAGYMRRAGLISVERHQTSQIEAIYGSTPELSIILAATRPSSPLETPAALR